MPVKRRLPKVKRTPEEEAAIWAPYFDGGSFLLAGSEAELGLAEDADLDLAARDAWGRLGALYLGEGIGRREGVDCGHGRWALETFGEPRHAG